MEFDQEQENVVLEPNTPVTASVIWLHGLGADGHDFEAIVPELGIADELGVRFIFPHAPHRPVTINNGYVMRAWYDLVGIDRTSPHDEQGIGESEDITRKLIQQELDNGVSVSRIVLAGFSQGGAVVLHTALRYPQRLAGVLALSTYLPMPEKLPEELHASNQDIPVWMAHGTADDVVPVSMGEHSRDLLVSLGYHVDWNAYLMPHSVCPDEIQNIADWLKKILV